MSNRIELEIKDHIAHVQFNRPEKMNALDLDFFHSIIECCEQIEANTAIRVVVVSGKGKAFCAGIDLSMFAPGSPMDKLSENLNDRTHGISNMWQKAVWAWRELSVPVIAAAHGTVFGGGLQIMLAADIKYIHPETRLSILESKWGIIPDMGGTQLMRHNVRDDMIRELTYTHRIFTGVEAVDYGFATHTSEDPVSEALKLATEICTKSPSAIVLAKELYNQAPYLNEAEGLALESKLQHQLLKKHNQLESIFSNLQKREANFKDYRKS